MPRHVLIKPVAPLLADRGYREIRSTGIHVRELTPGIEAWVGLNTGRRLGGLVVNPNLGVRHTRVMRWVSVLRGERPLGAAAPPLRSSCDYVVSAMAR